MASLRAANDELDRHVQERTTELEQRTVQVIQQARLLDLANDAIFVREADDRISQPNEGAERLCGWAKREAVGQSPHDPLSREFQHLTTLAGCGPEAQPLGS